MNSVAEFLTAIRPYPNELWIFRGQADGCWQLLPKAGRPEYFSPDTNLGNDLTIFGHWRDQAVAFTDSVPDNDFECLAYAQHYGLATRLLDWTSNPIVALYFAVETHADKNGAVFAHWPSLEIKPTKDKLQGFDYVAFYRPRPFDRRLLSQSAVDGCPVPFPGEG